MHTVQVLEQLISAACNGTSYFIMREPLSINLANWDEPERAPQ